MRRGARHGKAGASRNQSFVKRAIDPRVPPLRAGRAPTEGAGDLLSRRRRTASGAANVRGAKTLRALLDLEIDQRALLEIIEVHPDEPRAVEKHLLTVVAPDEAETAIPNDLRNRPARHNRFPTTVLRQGGLFVYEADSTRPWLLKPALPGRRPPDASGKGESVLSKTVGAHPSGVNPPELN